MSVGADVNKDQLSYLLMLTSQEPIVMSVSPRSTKTHGHFS